MPTLDVVVSSRIERTFRVEQIAGIFDLKLQDKTSEHFTGELPGDDEDWQIGVIVGPSGSGKSTIARQAYGDALIGSEPWPEGKAVIDGFPLRAGIKRITEALTSVGFSSPPS